MTITAIKAPLVRVSSIIDDEDAAILMSIRDNLRNNYFAIGDMANKYILTSAKHGYTVTADDIHTAVGNIVGKSARTIRYYSEQSSFYDFKTRDQYDILPFSVFVFARAMGERWQEVLDYAMENPQKSAAAIRNHFLHDVEATPQDEQEEISEQETIICNRFITVLVDMSSRILNAANILAISDDARKKLVTAAGMIQEVVDGLA